MGDNLNANGAAPVAPYVFLSFLFEIVVEFMFLVCVLDSICSSTMLVHMISLISVIDVMIYFVLIRIKSLSNLLIYSTDATSPTATPSCAPFGGRCWNLGSALARLLAATTSPTTTSSRTSATSSSTTWATTSTPTVLLPLHPMCFCPSCLKSW